MQLCPHLFVAAMVLHLPSLVLRALRELNEGRGAAETEVKNFVRTRLREANSLAAYDDAVVSNFLRQGATSGMLLTWPRPLPSSEWVFAIKNDDTDFEAGQGFLDFGMSVYQQ